jgi:excinuclease ABC subunit A
MPIAAETTLPEGISPPPTEVIRIRGARMHNLKNVDIDIPRDRLVVITGPSGSGKSSLAFDTLYAEGQRQYVESLSVYARQFLHQMERPEVDLIDGLEPTICIDQRPGMANPRSTVATTTEIYDYLRLLLARLGEVTCHQCGAPIRQQSEEQIQAALLALPEGTKIMLLAPLVRGRRGAQGDAYAAMRKAGFVRARIDGQVHEMDHLPELDPRKNHTIEAVVDRVIIREGIKARVGESIQLAVRHGQGLVTALYLEPAQEAKARAQGANATSETFWTERLFSTLYACPDCGISFEELEPRTFSFNSPYGACPACEGLGVRIEFDPDLVLPDATLGVTNGAIAPWKGLKSAVVKKGLAEVEKLLASQGIEKETPWGEYTPAQRELLLRGNGKQLPGLLTLLEKEYATATDEARKTELELYRGSVTCAVCEGSRLRREAMGVRLGGKAIHEITALSVREGATFFGSLTFPTRDEPVSQPLVQEISRRLEFLQKVGVDYLTLNRAADTLSGGELQRVRLATSIGSGLVGVCYVLDEPSIGLHPRDNQRLIEALRDLQRQGSTVVVVEHDEAVMRQADWLIDMGPAAGEGGGYIIAQGTPAEVMEHPASITGRYLSHAMRIEVPAVRRKVTKTRAIVIEGCVANNLKNVNATFPLGVFVCVTGVSGSGKSSLINETLVPAVIRRLDGRAAKPGPHTSLRGVSQVDKVIPIDQSAIGRSPRSNPATYLGVFDEVRKVFASTRQAKQFGFTASRFSFNSAGGRCEACQGQGVTRIEMNFLPDLFVPCAECGGKRFNAQTLQVKYRGQSIADVLAMSVDQAATFFENISQIHRLLVSMQDVGLGYLQLGQPSTTLSGGEAQRIKLAAELARVETGNTLYVLDEPTTGLHFDDIRRLLAVLQRLVDRGNTVIVIEHNLDVIKCADWILDLGPDGGSRGGEILATGTPEDIAARDDNETGKYLRETLSFSPAVLGTPETPE